MYIMIYVLCIVFRLVFIYLYLNLTNTLIVKSQERKGEKCRKKRKRFSPSIVLKTIDVRTRMYIRIICR